MSYSAKIKDWRSLRGWRVYFFIFVLGLLLYSRTLFFDFSYLDDNTLIIDNYPIISNVKNIGLVFGSDAFFSPDKFYYRPLLTLSFMADAAIAGALPVVFHFSNILWHILAAILVFRLFLKWQGSRNLALAFSLLFLVHPVLTQAVAWIPGRNDSILTVFVLAGFLAFLNFCDSPRLLYYIAYLSFLFLALLTKETAIFLPVLVVFYFLFISPKKVAIVDRYLLLGGSAVIGFSWFLMRHFALGGETTQYSDALIQIIRNSPAILVYLGKLIFPFNLAVFPILPDSSKLYGLIVLGLLAAAWFFSREKRNNYVIFSFLWFFLFLLPSFIRINGLPDFLEHRLYLSFVGFMLFLGELRGVKSLDFGRKNVKIVTAIILLFLAGLTWFHSAKFSDRFTFWQAAAASSPHSPLAQRNLGVMYYFNRDVKQAQYYYQKALDLNPREPMVHNNLGVIYLDQKDYVRAEKEFKAELIVNPNYDKALANLARVEHLLAPQNPAVQ